LILNDLIKAKGM